MDPLRMLLRAKRLAQHPPSSGRVRLVMAVVAICVVLVLIEKVVGWPAWLTVEGLRRPLR